MYDGYVILICIIYIYTHTQYNTIQHNTIQYNHYITVNTTLQYIPHYSIYYITVKYSTKQCIAIQYNAMQCNTKHTTHTIHTIHTIHTQIHIQIHMQMQMFMFIFISMPTYLPTY